MLVENNKLWIVIVISLEIQNIYNEEKEEKEAQES